MTAVILLIFLLSGFAGLAYELVWVRTLSLVFGVSSQAISTVLAAFMGGLALGSLIFGRRADRSRSPLRLYAGLEVGIAVSALLLPYSFSMINRLYVSMAQTFPAHSWTFTTTRFLLCFAALLVPTTLMGGTLPAISRFFVVRLDRVGRGTGLLYGVNTVGGVLGCLVASFLLLGLLGARGTTLVAAVVNLGVALAALRIAARYARIDAVAGTPSAPPQQQDAASEPHPPRAGLAETSRPWLGTFVLVAYGIAGGSALAYEVLWTRVLVYFVGMTVYSFAIILATFLAGLALGSFYFAPIADRRKDLLSVFGLLELAIGLSAVGLLQTIGVVFSSTAGHLSVLGLLGRHFAQVSLLMLVPTFLMGAVFPVVTRLYTPQVRWLGGSLGNLYAANTVGAVLGSLLAGFVLLPALGAQKSVVLVAAINALLGMVALVLSPSRTRMRQWALGLAIPSLLVAGFVSARIRPTVTYCPAFRHEALNTLLYYREGAEASLAVLGGPLGNRGLNINGETTAYNNYFDITVHKMLGHVPMLLAKEPRSALIIGFGLGSTAASVACYPLERIDCVELVPEETETARYFLADNRDVLNDPRFHFIVGDGRNHLLTCRANYDAISMNAIHPSYSPYLYTREFYELCRSRLGENGVMCAWLPTNSLYFATLIKTFQSVFPHSSLWLCTGYHCLLIGTVQAFSVDFSRWQAMMGQTAVGDSLAEVWLDAPVRLLSTMILDEEALEAFCGQAALNTDDLPLAGSDWFIPAQAALDNVTRLFAAQSPVYPYVSKVGNEEARGQLAESFERHFAAIRYLPDADYIARRSRNPAQAAEWAESAVAACPENPRIRYERARTWISLLKRSPNATMDREVRLCALTALQGALPREDTAAARRGPPERFIAPLRLNLAIMYLLEEQPSAAQREAELVLRLDPNEPTAREVAAQASLQLMQMSNRLLGPEGSDDSKR